MTIVASSAMASVGGEGSGAVAGKVTTVGIGAAALLLAWLALLVSGRRFCWQGHHRGYRAGAAAGMVTAAGIGAALLLAWSAPLVAAIGL